MALSDVTFNRGQGGLGRPLAGSDYISGLTTYLLDATITGLSGFSTSDRIKVVYSTEEAEALGIVEGAAAGVDVVWYHVSEFFRVQPKGKLYIGLYDNVTPDLSAIETVQNFANGEIRQMGVFSTATFAGADVTTLQTSATAVQTAHRPMSVLYAADISATSDLSTLADMRALTAPNVSVVIGEDGNGAGAALAVSSGASVTTLGATLGAVSVASVHENIGWVSKFNMVTGTELDVPAFGNGDLAKNLTTTLLSGIQDKGYIFIKKHEGISGTYHNDSGTSVAATSDYAYIESQRTIDKAVRGVRTFMLPDVNGPITVNSDGTLGEGTLALFKNDADRALEQMLRAEEISAFEVSLDPSQDVLATSQVEVSIKIVPRGVSRQIVVNIGFAVSI